jgi:hypothetical protein
MDGVSTEMMIVMHEGSTAEEVERILERLESAGASGHVSTSDVVTVIAVMGEREVVAGLPLEAYPGWTRSCRFSVPTSWSAGSFAGPTR